MEQHSDIKLCQKLDDCQMETIQKIQMALGVTQIKDQCNQFKDGHTSVDSEPHSCRPLTSQNDQVIAKVNAMVMWDHHVTIREIAEEVDISTFLAHSILTKDLAMMRVAAKFVLKLAEQKQVRVEVSQDMLDSINSDPDFKNTIITQEAIEKIAISDKRGHYDLQ